MDLASVVAALASIGVRVSGFTPNSSVQVDSSRACPTGLAGPEPSGTFHDPGQHFQSRLCFASSLTLLHSKIKRIRTLRLGGKRKIDQSLSGWKACACSSNPTEEQEAASAEEKVHTAKDHTKNKRPPTPRNGIRMV